MKRYKYAVRVLSIHTNLLKGIMSAQCIFYDVLQLKYSKSFAGWRQTLVSSSQMLSFDCYTSIYEPIIVHVCNKCAAMTYVKQRPYSYRWMQSLHFGLVIILWYSFLELEKKDSRCRSSISHLVYFSCIRFFLSALINAQPWFSNIYKHMLRKEYFE